MGYSNEFVMPEGMTKDEAEEEIRRRDRHIFQVEGELAKARAKHEAFEDYQKRYERALSRTGINNRWMQAILVVMILVLLTQIFF